jgi:hypothetical protein
METLKQGDELFNIILENAKVEQDRLLYTT